MQNSQHKSSRRPRSRDGLKASAGGFLAALAGVFMACRSRAPSGTEGNEHGLLNT